MTEDELLKKWRDVLEREIVQITAGQPKVKKLEKSSVLNAWQTNRKRIESKLEDRNMPLLQWDVEDFPSNNSMANGGKTGGSKKVKLMDGKKVVSEGHVMDLPKAETCPNWTTWIPIQRNLMPDKALPTNIPYFGDEVIEKDKNFIGSLEEEVNHVNIESLNDEKFLQLVEAVDKHKDAKLFNVKSEVFHPKSKCESQYCSESAKNGSLPRLFVFQVIHACYPEYGSTEQHINRYKNLNKSLRKEQFAPNIDGPDAMDLPAEKTLHTFKTLLCRRCFLFDCPLHKDDPPVDERLQQPNAKYLPLPTEPCNSNCYKNNNSNGALSPRTPMSERRKEKLGDQKELYSDEYKMEVAAYLGGSNSKLDSWTNAEKCLYRVLIGYYPGNFCAVAKILATKSCEDVFQFSVKEGSTSRGEKRKVAPKVNKFGKSSQAQLYKHTENGWKENKKPYIPCHHPGSDCLPGVCSCRENGNFCEKFCYCPISCSTRFPGCRCRGNCKTKMCPCFFASRECDPDLCNNCLDGKLELNPSTNSCQNVYLQRYLGKKLHVAQSDIAGMGCFLGETAEKGDFIAEYVGEMINQDECESRGRVYDKSKMSYMFTLNDEYTLDAARFGGIIRFANHSSKPNCQSKILLVNGDHRIGIYAKQKIEKGEELFFDYGKDFVGHDLI
eukprot:TRINITY_DN8905_c0_g1_i2.p1 TRINITY_DN8905_c0_g1~~TRINITY_DN8905_c0_g1_i2.p1  ORF type:complete len:674 (-),score=159.49 TRINITY_DN8905_c0_g1_i2:418-2415(-)